MKKLILIIILLPMLAFSQKSFIGQTKKQVRNFWETKVSSTFIAEGKYTDSNEDYFVIQDSENSIKPIFSATFDKSGKCINHSTQLEIKKVSVWQANFKKNGYTFDKSKSIWVNKANGIAWKINCNISCDAECAKIDYFKTK
jgi:hypothetical protein